MSEADAHANDRRWANAHERVLQAAFERRQSNLIGRLLTAGSELYADVPAHVYHQQLAYVNDDQRLLVSKGSTIDARKFLAKAAGGNRWVQFALEMQGLYFLYSADSDEPAGLTHQARILHELCSMDSATRTVICCLPHHSGRTTAALVAMFHTLVERLGSVLFVSPTQRAAEVVVKRVSQFLDKSGWSKGITLRGYFRGAIQAAAGEEVNVAVATPQGLDGLLQSQYGRQNQDLFLADVNLVVVDSAEEYYGTYGSHASLIFRRLRRILDAHGAAPRFLVMMAPHQLADLHVATLLGFENDTPEFQRTCVTLGVGDDAKPRDRKVLGFWAPPLRFAGQNRLTPVHQLGLKRFGVKDGLPNLLNALAFILEKLPQTQEPRPRTLIVLSRDFRFTSDDAHELLQFPRWDVHVVHSMNELDEDSRRYDRRALVAFGYPGSLQTLMHDLSHFGGPETLLVVAVGSDPLSQYLIKDVRGYAPELTQGPRGEIAAASLGRTEQELVINPQAERILEAHLWRAAREPGGLAEQEAKRYFGHEALRILATQDALFEPRTQACQGYTQTVYHARSSDQPRPIDLHCADWDRVGDSQRLVPIEDLASNQVVGYVEKDLVHAHASAGLTRLCEGRRFVITRADPTGVFANVGAKIEYRERLSEFSIEPEGNDVLTEKLSLSTSQASRANLVFDLRFTQVTVREKVLAIGQYDGYIGPGQRLGTVPGSPSGQFVTHALLLRFSDLEISRETVHAVKHALKVALPMYLRFDPEELEVVLGSPPGMKRAPGPDAWDIIFYDHHPAGDCYARKLRSLSGNQWVQVFDTCYDILARCPCNAGCHSCLILPNCRDASPVGGNTWQPNQGLDKRGALDFLGRALDKFGHDLRMELMFGDSGTYGHPSPPPR